jgi:hypothetical protein
VTLLVENAYVWLALALVVLLPTTPRETTPREQHPVTG